MLVLLSMLASVSLSVFREISIGVAIAIDAASTTNIEGICIFGDGFVTVCQRFKNV